MRNFTQEQREICLRAPRVRAEVFTKLMKIPGVQMIYVSALACTRHRNIDFIEMQRKGRLSFLLFNQVDMITGDYIQKTKDAAAEIAAERDPSGIILLTGCQSALLSTDYNLLSEEIGQEIGCPVRVHDGCRLCGFDEEKGGAGNIDRLLYSFILPAEKSAQVSVNILGSAEPDEGSELFDLLKCSGVTAVNCLSRCKSFADYQKMGSAHVNILTDPRDLPIAQHLQDTLHIPYVCLGGIYDGAELGAAYQKLAEILRSNVDITSFQSRLNDKLDRLKAAVGDRPITVEGDAELAKWLLCAGFCVESLTLNPHQGLSQQQKAWFDEYAPHCRVKATVKGGRGGGEHGGGEHGGGEHGRGEGRGGEKPHGLMLGFAGSMAALSMLERALGGDAR